jgi:hypothetical protein
MKKASFVDGIANHLTKIVYVARECTEVGSRSRIGSVKCPEAAKPEAEMLRVITAVNATCWNASMIIAEAATLESSTMIHFLTS